MPRTSPNTYEAPRNQPYRRWSDSHRKHRPGTPSSVPSSTPPQIVPLSKCSDVTGQRLRFGEGRLIVPCIFCILPRPRPPTLLPFAMGICRSHSQHLLYLLEGHTNTMNSKRSTECKVTRLIRLMSINEPPQHAKRLRQLGLIINTSLPYGR